MKKRRTLIITCLLIAALALGIGYAGFTSDLSVSGEAVIGATDVSQVVISNITLADSSTAEITVTPDGLNTKAATVDVTGFKEPNEYAVIDVTVSNPHPFAVSLSAPALTITNNDLTGGGSYFAIEIVDPTSIPTTIAADGSVTFQVRVQANVITADAHTTNFRIDFSASTRT